MCNLILKCGWGLGAGIQTTEEAADTLLSGSPVGLVMGSAVD